MNKQKIIDNLKEQIDVLISDKDNFRREKEFAEKRSSENLTKLETAYKQMSHKDASILRLLEQVEAYRGVLGVTRMTEQEKTKYFRENYF